MPGPRRGTARVGARSIRRSCARQGISARCLSPLGTRSRMSAGSTPTAALAPPPTRQAAPRAVPSRRRPRNPPAWAGVLVLHPLQGCLRRAGCLARRPRGPRTCARARYRRSCPGRGLHAWAAVQPAPDAVAFVPVAAGRGRTSQACGEGPCKIGNRQKGPGEIACLRVPISADDPARAAGIPGQLASFS